jgi:hypothetical protein
MTKNLITLLVPACAYRIMFNGYATPYSISDTDWMADATFVADLDAYTLELVNSVVEWKRAGDPVAGCVIDPVYINRYVKPHLTRAMNNLANAGYQVKFI